MLDKHFEVASELLTNADFAARKAEG